MEKAILFFKNSWTFIEWLFTSFTGWAYILFVFLGMKTDVVRLLFYLMVIDSVLGVLKSIRLKQRFSFKILLWGMVTKLSILIIPMILALLGKAMTFDFTYFVVAVMNVIIVSEGISCITNIISIKSNKEIENVDYITMMLQVIKKALSKIIKKFLNAIEG